MPIVYANIPQSIYCSRLTSLPSCVGFFYSGHEIGALGRVRRQQGLHLPHHLRWLHVANFWKLMQLERSGPEVHGVPGHKQCLQLLVGVLSVLVDLRQAVVHAAADVRGQGGEQVIIFC